MARVSFLCVFASTLCMYDLRKGDLFVICVYGECFLYCLHM